MSDTAPAKRNSEQEAKAVLHVTAPDPDVVTRALAMVPDNSWPAGHTRPGYTIPARCGSWRLEEAEIGIPEDAYYGAAVERCLRRLLARIDPVRVRRGLAGLVPPARAIVVLTGYAYYFPNPLIPADLVAKIAELGADIEEDFYLLPAETGDDREAG
ncbi:MAG: hypothetical protein ACREFP_08375 [Acetobacteraceae bacterium]